MAFSLPLFVHPGGFWALLGWPLILAIHFFQQRSKIVPTSTLFLIGPLDPESRAGRTWDRLRSSRALGCQLLLVPLCAWLLSEPRWLLQQSAQTVVAVVDNSASMSAFRNEAIAAVRERFAFSVNRAAHTQWIVLTSDAREPALYRGPDLSAAEKALDDWRPTLGTHDPNPSLRLAAALAGPRGLVWYVSDTRENVPAEQTAIGVGRPLANVGFAGVSVSKDGDHLVWHALVQNHTDQPQHRAWWIENSAGRGAEQSLDLGPNGMVELSGRFPSAEDRCTLALTPDEFELDDKLPLVRPVPRSLIAEVKGSDESTQFFKKVLNSVDGVTLGTGPEARLHVIRATDTPHPELAGATVLLPTVKPQWEEFHALRDPVTAERNALVNGLNWQGWLGSGPDRFEKKAADIPLLWQGASPLVWMSGTSDESRHLVLNFDWETTNAARLPATVLFLRRFVQAVQAAQPGRFTGNFDTNQPLAIKGRANGTMPSVLTYSFSSVFESQKSYAQTVEASNWDDLRAPATAGFFELREGNEVWLRGAVQFSDPRQSDFRKAESFALNLPSDASAVRERNTRPDPFALLWLGLLGGLLLLSWWPSRQRRHLAVEPTQRHLVPRALP